MGKSTRIHSIREHPDRSRFVRLSGSRQPVAAAAAMAAKKGLRRIACRPYMHVRRQPRLPCQTAGGVMAKKTERVMRSRSRRRRPTGGRSAACRPKLQKAAGDAARARGMTLGQWLSGVLSTALPQRRTACRPRPRSGGKRRSSGGWRVWRGGFDGERQAADVGCRGSPAQLARAGAQPPPAVADATGRDLGGPARSRLEAVVV